MRLAAAPPHGHPPYVLPDNLRRCRISLTTRELAPEETSPDGYNVYKSNKKGYDLSTTVNTGWAEIDVSGEWLHFHDDEGEGTWQSFSRESVNWIEWERVA